MPTDDYEDDDRPRRPRNSRDDDAYDDEPVRRRDRDEYDDAPRPRKKEGEGLAIASMICGILSIPLACCCGLFSLPLSGAALIMGFIAKGKTGGDGKSMTGIITGAIGIALAVLSVILAMMDVFKFDPQQFNK